MKKIEEIVLALDGSALARRVLPYAATLASKAGARLLVRAASAHPLFQDDVAAAQLAATAEAVADFGGGPSRAIAARSPAIVRRQTPSALAHTAA